MTVLERRKREFRQREGTVLAAALALFNRDDWQTVTIDQIAAKAEIGKGTVYKHFATKDEIYAKLVVSFQRSILAEFRKIDLSQPPLRAIGELIAVFWRTQSRAPEHKRLIRYCRREDFHHVIGEKLSRELDELDEEMMSFLVPVIERGIREGSIIAKPVASVMLGLHAAMIGLMEMEGVECMKTGLTAERQYEEVREFALRGISRR
ncbi:MAG: TetR/AcrR family transcriptional regulator [Elusimicrobiota bacterium]